MAVRLSRLQIISGIFLLVIALLSGLLVLVIRSSPFGEIKLTFNKPNAYADNLTITRYNNMGDKASYLYTPKLQHFEKENLTQFSNPHIILYSETQKPWDITANKGITDKNFQNVTLIGHVRLHQVAGQHNNNMTITTSKLHINTKKQTAFTQAPVTLYEKGNDKTTTIIKSVGIRVNQKTGVIRLLTHAQGYYQPASPIAEKNRKAKK